MLASAGKISMLQPETGSMASGRSCPDRSRTQTLGKTALKVIASSIRKGNVIEQDGKLYVVLTAENIHPGKVWFDLEDGDGKPSRWNTLRAMRVLRWYEQLSSI